MSFTKKNVWMSFEEEDRRQFTKSSSKYWAKSNLQTMDNNKTRKKTKEMRWKWPTTTKQHARGISQHICCEQKWWAEFLLFTHAKVLVITFNTFFFWKLHSPPWESQAYINVLAGYDLTSIISLSLPLLTNVQAVVQPLCSLLGDEKGDRHARKRYQRRKTMNFES